MRGDRAGTLVWRGLWPVGRWNQGGPIRLCGGLESPLELPGGQVAVKLGKNSQRRDFHLRPAAGVKSEMWSTSHSKAAGFIPADPLGATDHAKWFKLLTTARRNRNSTPRYWQSDTWKRCHTLQRVKFQEQILITDKGYRHLFHKLIPFVVCFGEMLDVVLQPLDMPLHSGQTALQDLSRHCGNKKKED